MSSFRVNINGNESNECIEIERSRVSIGKRIADRLSKCMPNRLYWWQLVCAYTAILGITSLSVVMYLKAMGDITPFCLYDNWYYTAYYLFLCVYALVMVPFSDFQLIPYTSLFWRWARRIGAYICFIELEGAFYFVVFFNDIYYEIEYDEESQIVVLSMVCISLTRLLTTCIGYWRANSYLKRVQQRHQLAANHFGNTFIDICDILICQLLYQSIVFYNINVYNMAFIISITYFYIVFARI